MKKTVAKRKPRKKTDRSLIRFIVSRSESPFRAEFIYRPPRELQGSKSSAKIRD